MTIISPNFATKVQQSFNNNILDSKILNKIIYAPAKENPAKFAGKMALVSALTKDAVGCYYYVTQSLENEKIPEDKRKFVASLDLMNGILNVALQFTVGMWIDKKVPEWFDKTVGKSLDTDETVKEAKSLSKSIEKMHLKEKIEEADIATFLREKVLGQSGNATKLLKIGFSAAAVLIATQVITKRVVVPFLSTPLASWYKEHYMDKKKPGGPDAGKVAPQTDFAKLNACRFLDKKAFDQFTKE
jgi:hypothetical protein